MTSVAELKELLRLNDVKFWGALTHHTNEVTGLDEVLFLTALRRRASATIPRNAEPLRIALIGGCSLHPFREAIEHMLTVAGFAPVLFVGGYDNYNAEILEDASPLYGFSPDVTLMLPSADRCRYLGALSDPAAHVRESVSTQSNEILQLCDVLHRRSNCEVLLANFIPGALFDPGPLRAKALGSEWSFRKAVNAELGLSAPAYVHICDLEFLASRRGLLASRDERGWFESKQLCAPDLQLDIAREVAHMVRSLRHPHAKVLAVDLDNTLWGGVIGDDGIEGIEIGATSPRGEAFRAFQKHILALYQRGILLAVCSKNDYAIAVEPFEKHPEMVLRLDHFAAFYANWKPKSENLRAIALDLNLGLDSIVFIDDNPAEVELVRQYAPEVRGILLGPDPASYVAQLGDSRLFEPIAVTAEDLARGMHYSQEKRRRSLCASTTDMNAYLASLEMCAVIKPFLPIDLKRITQLINKSNQFNLTTVRRTEAEVQCIAADPFQPTLTVRLSDRFGDHGLVAVVICEVNASGAIRDLEIGTWVMSCRVLQREVEQEVLNEIFAIARERECRRVIGRYAPSAKNSMVCDFYPRMEFESIEAKGNSTSYARDVASFVPFKTKISARREDA